MDSPTGGFVNQTMIAKKLGVSIPEALELLAGHGYWDEEQGCASRKAVDQGLARVIDHPLTGTVSMWTVRVVDLVAEPDISFLHVRDSDAVGEGGQLVRSGRAAVAAEAPLPARAPGESRTGGSVEIFLASSIDEFGSERSRIAGILHSVDRSFSSYMAEYDPDGDSQESINRHIETSDYFIAIIGRRLGIKTAEEISRAIRQFEARGKPRVKFFVQKFVDGQAQRSQEVDRFVTDLYEEGTFYPREFADSQELIDQVELFFRRLRK